MTKSGQKKIFRNQDTTILESGCSLTGEALDVQSEYCGFRSSQCWAPESKLKPSEHPDNTDALLDLNHMT